MFSGSFLRYITYFITCRQSGSLAPDIVAEGCPISQISVDFRVAGLFDEDGRGSGTITSSRSGGSSSRRCLPLLVVIINYKPLQNRQQTLLCALDRQILIVT